ncbi:MAG: hypothetical protein CMI18_01090 [Opitutaceae bacterium]|nr:hypothetical protein [Opitutaceae bacterium]
MLKPHLRSMEPDPKVQRDYLIVGQGLAGSLMALNLLNRGKSVLVVDDGHKHAASKVAAGLINPITGRRHALSWRFLDCWSFLLGNYILWEKEFGKKFFHRMPLIRSFKNKEEQRLFEDKLHSGQYSGIEIEYPFEPAGLTGLKSKGVCYRLQQSGYVDQRVFIQAARHRFLQEGNLVKATWKKSEFSQFEDGVQWRNYQAKRVLFSQGYLNGTNDFFRDLPFRNVKGEILDLNTHQRIDPPILNCGKWLLPLGAGRYYAGATYDLQNMDQEITPKARYDILQGVSELVDWDWVVEKQQAGVRPALHDFKPVMGRHPWHGELVIFNGLGSKGSLMAPLLAKELTEHLENGAALHPESDVDRFRTYL